MPVAPDNVLHESTKNVAKFQVPSDAIIQEFPAPNLCVFWYVHESSSCGTDNMIRPSEPSQHTRIRYHIFPLYQYDYSIFMYCNVRFSCAD